jgi:bacteriorhodopsin
VLIEFSGTQWSAITDNFELIALTLLATAIYGFATQSRVLFKYRNIVALASVMCLIDFISYAKLLVSFISASDGNNVLFGAGHSTFDYSVRYVAWIICVPIQVTIIIKLVAANKSIASSLIRRAVPAVVIMMILGYLGEINSRLILILGLAASIVFLYVLWVIFSPLKTLLHELSEDVRRRFIRLRLLMVILWCIYPILYFLNASKGLNLESSNFLVAQQLILVAADLMSKAYFSFEVFKITRMKSAEEGLPIYE